MSATKPTPAMKRDPASGNFHPDRKPFAGLDPAWTEKAIAFAIAPSASGALLADKAGE